ncbi:MAG: hypothetical protein KUG81_11120 [Gammaproteobacteria bacterium]|nr:hypothetical protein [Gammaproteobacteria bacterium]
MKSKLKGGESTINKDYQIPVIDTAEAASKFPFRSFDINTLKVLKVNKQSYQVDGAVVL